MYPTVTPGELARRVERAGARAVVADPASVPLAPELPVRITFGGPSAGWRSLYDAAAESPRRPHPLTRADDPLFAYFTSGTTAEPKMVQHTHVSYPVGHLSSMYWNGLRPGDEHLNVSSPGWAKHSWSSFFVPWNAGATVVAVHSSVATPERLLAEMRRVTSVCAPPVVWRGVAALSLGARPAALRELTSAGERLDDWIIERVFGSWGLRIREGYGQTETTGQLGVTPGTPEVAGRLGLPLPGIAWKSCPTES